MWSLSARRGRSSVYVYGMEAGELRTPGSHVVFRRQDQPGLSLHTALLPPCKSAASRTPGTPNEPLRMRRWAGSRAAQGRGLKRGETSRSSGPGELAAEWQARVRV